MYLSSYENCGIVEVWLEGAQARASEEVDVINGKNKEGLLVCCDKSKPGIGSSYSAYLDTLDTTTNTSEVKTKTFKFKYTAGTFLVYIRHKPQSKVMSSRRGGDKVKLLGLRSC